jgi:hypothetical protein
MKRAAPVCADPQIVVLPCAQGQHRADTCSDLRGLQRIARLKETAVFSFGLRAVPQLTARVPLNSLDEERARAALNFFDHAVLNDDYAAAARTDVKYIVLPCKAREIKRPWFFKISARERSFGNGFDLERFVRVRAAIENYALVAGKDSAPALGRDDGRDGFAFRFAHGAKLIAHEAHRARFSSNPEDAFLIQFEREHAL